MADPIFVLTVLIIAIALIFDYVNGFHDAANSIATVVSTRVLTPLQGVAWAAVWNFVAAFTFGTAVAKTIGSGLLDVPLVVLAIEHPEPSGLGRSHAAIARRSAKGRLILVRETSHLTFRGDKAQLIVDLIREMSANP